MNDQCQCVEEKKQYEIEREFQKLRGGIATVADQNITLQKKLSLVMQSSKVKECDPKKEEMRPSSPLGIELRELSNQINLISNTLSDILIRLEI